MDPESVAWQLKLTYSLGIRALWRKHSGPQKQTGNGSPQRTALAPGKKAHPTTLNFRTKLAADGSIAKRKVRLCTRGDLIPPDENEVRYSPVTKFSIVRLILALSVQLAQVDIKRAYLQGRFLASLSPLARLGLIFPIILL